MRLNYKKPVFGIPMPIISIGIGLRDITVQYSALIDSGAAVNVMDAEMGELIGLNIKSGKKDSLEFIKGKGTLAYIHEISIEVSNSGFKFRAPVYFVENCTWPYGLLGERGFFNKFHVRFDQRNGFIDLSPYKEIN